MNQLFSVDERRYNVKKNIKYILLPLKIWKKNLKVAYFGKNVEIFSIGLGAQKTQKAQKAKFGTTKSLLIQDWVFRLSSDSLFCRGSLSLLYQNEILYFLSSL